MSRKITTDAQAAPEGEAVSETTATAAPAPTPAESFAAWWSTTIPNSPVSRNTPAYNKAHALRSQLLAVLTSVTGD